MTSLLVKSVTLLSAVLFSCLDHTVGHGRMIEPAARNTMWRFKYKNPRNYNDMGLNCGGFTNQFEQNGGRCGACGDPIQGPGDHEAGGKYARGVIARQYQVGSFINVTVELTSNHKGYMEFRLCPVNNPRVKATQTCLDSNLLNIIGHGTRYFITKDGANVFIQLLVMLPPKLQCSQCVLQWKWVAGQSMGPDGFGGECMGCGNQEHFINCADVAIGNKAVKALPQLKGPPSQAAPSVPKPGPAYNVVSHTSGTSAGYSAGYGTKTLPIPNIGYNPRGHRPAPPPRPKTTTKAPWNMNMNMNMDPNMMYQNYMEGGAFGMNGYAMTTPSPWGSPWQQEQQQQIQHQMPQQMPHQMQHQMPQQMPHQMQYQMPQQMPQQMPAPHQNPALSAMLGYMPNLYQMDTEAPSYHQRPDYVTPAPEPQHPPGHDPSDYAGNEPGEYPENEGPTPNHGGASGGNGGGASYMQGYNDALRQMQQGLGLQGEWNPKASRAVSEITLSLNEKQKQGSIPNCPGRVCKATGSWKGQANMDSWCDTTCKAGQCPDHMCLCSCPGAGRWVLH